MPTDITKTSGELMGVLRSIKKPSFHLRDRYFRAFHLSKGKKIFWDTVTGRPRIAPYVHPRLPGKPVERRGFKTESLEAPYVKPVTVVDPEEMLQRTPGEVFLGDLTAQQREDAAIALALLDHDEQIGVREEAQCAEALRTGTITLAGEGYSTQTIGFGRDATLTETLSGSGFNTNGFDVLAYIEARALRVYQKSNGFVVDEVTMDPDAWAAFQARITSDQKQMLFNSLRGSQSSIELGPVRPGDARYMGMIGQFQFFVYTNVYDDNDGNAQNMMPSGSLILTGSAVDGVRCYGAIRDRGYVSVRHFPKEVVTENPYQRQLLSQSSPLMVPWRVNASFGAQVLV